MSFIGNNPSWKTSTHKPQSADPTNPTEGMQFYSDGTVRSEGLWTYKNSTWIKSNSGSGVRNFAQDFECADSTSGYTTGQSTAFDDTGTITGVLASESTNPLFGEFSLKITSPALNDWISLRSIAIDSGARGKLLSFSIEYTWDGDTPARLKVLDGDGNDLSGSDIKLENTTTSSTGSIKQKVVWVQPSSGTASQSVTVGIHFTEAPGTTKTLIFDDIKVTDNALEVIEEAQGVADSTKYFVENGDDIVNDFSARIDNNTGTASITTQGPTDFIASATNTGTGKASLTFATGQFTVIPAITVSAEGTSEIASILSLSTTTVEIATYDETGALINTDFSIKVSKQGSDTVTGRAVAAIAGKTHENDSSIATQTISGYGSTNDAIRQLGTVVTNSGSAFEITQSATLGDKITILEAGTFNISASDQFSAGAGFGISKNSSQLTTAVQSITAANLLKFTNTSAANEVATLSWEGPLVAGDVIRLHGDKTADGTNTALTSFSISKSGKQPLLDAGQVKEADSYKKVTDSNDTGSTDTRIRLFDTELESQGSDITVSSTPANGTIFTIVKDGEYKITLTETMTIKDTFGISKNSSELTTNIEDITQADRLAMALTPGANEQQTISWSGPLQAGDVIRAHTGATLTSGTETDLASMSISKIGDIETYSSNVYNLNPLPVLFLKDIKSSGTNGGTATAGSYETRDLNNVSGDSSFLISLSSNQFTLKAGTYRINAMVPGGQVNQQKARLQNITDAVTAVQGAVRQTTSGTFVVNDCPVRGEFTIIASKVFEIQHRVSVSNAGDGHGSAASFGDDEIYTIVEITKIA